MATKMLKANDTYGSPGTEIALRLGTGGAGQSGLLRVMAEAYIKKCVDNNQRAPFHIEWYASDTSVSIDYLKRGIVDLAITYHAIAEYTAMIGGVADRVEYAWRDHWMLVGPKTNPAKLPEDGKSSIYTLFMKLYSAMEETKFDTSPIGFLSRYDSSACNILESSIWAAIGQVPWAPPQASWYTMCSSLPFEALKAASERGEYTITDYGTFCAIEESVREEMAVFAKGTDNEHDPLLNPAHLLVGTRAKNKPEANAFVDWMMRHDAGQEVIRTFGINGTALYTEAPMNVDPLWKARTIIGTTEPVKVIINTPRAGK